ncbi:hypothetical protein [Curtobacterium sp. MEB011]|uniref:hypothetical protein n=1 Tax=Curtobacterium sp. MEB011 TaxID=3040285 RepID=UPI002549F1EC|nr:hypothetical protein [Curtobacterium sp. MEB011]
MPTREIAVGKLEIPDASRLIFRDSGLEERASASFSRTDDSLRVDQKVVISDETPDAFEYVSESGEQLKVDLHSFDAVVEFLAAAGDKAWLDITGLGHNTWAPLVRTSIQVGKPLTVIYAQPAEYVRTGEFYDLSERVEGIRPLPGFVRLGLSDEPSIFLPLLGFEGSRFEYMADRSDVDLQETHPVVGAPGFFLEYVHEVFAENRLLFEQNAGLHRRVAYAKANCPFDLFWLLDEFSAIAGDSILKVAMIGTKPHALGAVLYATLNPAAVELLYDHPIKSKGRTTGASKVCVYDIASHLASLNE